MDTTGYYGVCYSSVCNQWSVWFHFVGASMQKKNVDFDDISKTTTNSLQHK